MSLDFYFILLFLLLIFFIQDRSSTLA